MPLPFNVYIPGNPNPFYVPPPPPPPISTPAPAPTTVLPNSPSNPNPPYSAPATTQVFGPGGAKQTSSTVTPTQTPTRIVDPNLNSEQQSILDDLFINNLGWTEAFQKEMLGVYYSLWGKTIPTTFTIITAETTVLPNSAPAPAPASEQYSISNQIQQGMNALMQGEELPPFSQPPPPPGPNIFDTNSNAFSGILNQLTDISNSNWRETYDPYGLNPTPLPNTAPIDASYTPPQANYTLIIAGVGALVLVYFYTKNKT